MPIISVIIPTYNRERFIAECIQSVLNQTFQDFEIIITDNCSTDRTVEIIESFNDHRIKLFRHAKNMGAAESTNNCIRESSGKYIAWLASDDAWYPRKLEIQVKYLDEHPDIAAVFGKADWVNELGNVINNELFVHKHVFDYRNRTRLEWLRHFFEKGNCLCIPSSLVRKTCYTEIGMHDPALAVLYDFDFWVRICLKHEIMILNETLVRYRRMSDDSNESGNTRSTHIKSRFEYFEVLRHYLTITDPDEFLLIFPDATKYGKVTADTIPYFLGRIAIDSGFEFKVLWGQEAIFNLLQNKKIAQILEENCNFTYMDFIDIVREHDVFKIFVTQDIMMQVTEKEHALSAQTEEKEKAIQALSAQVKEKERKLSEIYQSRAWRMIMFLRNIREWLN